jgi:homoserine O-acetyltransferase/O-succinyltransferase
MMRSVFFAITVLVAATVSAQPAAFPAPVEADFVARDFAFASGERMPEVTIHYRTVGAPRKDADGVVRNGVLILHGTGEGLRARSDS